MSSKPDTRDKQLLLLAFYRHAFKGTPPEWVTKHPMWPLNNGKFDKKTCKAGYRSSADPGTDRLWEAIGEEYGVNINPS